MKLDRPISTRISQIVIAAVATGISVSVGGFLVVDFRQSMQAETSRYQAAAFAFAAAASDGVAEQDARKVLEVIRGVRNLPEVAYVAALDPAGRVVAEIGGGARLVGKENNAWWEIPTKIEVTADVRNAGVPVGSVLMRAEAKGLLDRYLDAALYSALFGGLLVGATSYLARLNVARVIRPLRDLTDQFIDIGQRSDLRRRLDKERNDEVGVLVDAFNEMFGHIDERDRLLQQHRETLEETVDARTVELRVAKDEADAANAAKSTFLATMSHEIRTPMNGMMVMAEMLSAAPLSPRHQRYAEIITRSGKNLVHIINDILDFSKIESGKIELEEIEFSIDSVIEDVACLFAERAREKGLSLAIFISPNVPIKVLGDPVRLTQIVSNLVNNGLKFTETGGVSIKVELADDGQIVVTVEDTGIGIASDQIGRIFTRFSQADSSITRKFGGTGLGLSISKQLTELMKGRIQVKSQVGNGSQFIVSVPFKTTKPAHRLPVRQGLAVALFDDDAVTRRSVVQALEGRGISVLDEAGVACRAVLIRAGTSYDLSNVMPGTPIILLRPFAATSVFIPDGLSVNVEVPLPVTRSVFDLVCAAIEDGDLSIVDLDRRDNGTSDIPNLRHLRVLAVDDVAVNREVLAEALKTFGVQADLAESGPDAIAQVRVKPYDVIFMDCSMPGMDGFEATKAIRAFEAEAARSPTLVIALTGHLMGKESGDWKDAGMTGYLAKPFNIAQLAKVFQDLELGDQPDSKVSVEVEEEEPLLSSETMAMFENIRTSTGADIRSKVFAMFRASALDAYRVAAAEILSDGPEGKRLIHALKSNCSSAGAARAASICQRIETMLASGATVDQLLLAELEGALDHTLAAMGQVESSIAA
ncbi:response regulator [Rhizobium sp. XQZ8]|uniref:ATP-binding protein n=1 Tax=Rhizobium populisoli TaxID=2859785 RepID=UPI001CA5D7F0|nr:ATP-binding protein [Rhizobium populisoli]MBW6425614.1 response regulator [Rhizobium populisoli]